MIQVLDEMNQVLASDQSICPPYPSLGGKKGKKDQGNPAKAQEIWCEKIVLGFVRNDVVFITTMVNNHWGQKVLLVLNHLEQIYKSTAFKF